MEAQVTVTQDTIFPVNKTTWEKQTKHFLVTYMVKELVPGDFFGLEELVRIGELQIEGKLKKIPKIRRQLKVTTTQNSKLLYLTATDFHKMFGELELIKMKKFTKLYDFNVIRERILASWKHKKKVGKQMTDLTKDGKSKMMGKWLNFAETKGTRNEELTQEMTRIKTIDVRIEKQLLGKE